MHYGQGDIFIKCPRVQNVYLRWVVRWSKIVVKILVHVLIECTPSCKHETI